MQGVVGSLPWQAMVYFTLWLQLLGFSGEAYPVCVPNATCASSCAWCDLLLAWSATTSKANCLLPHADLAASSLMAVFALGTSFGHVLGGSIGEPSMLRLLKSAVHAGCVWLVCAAWPLR